MMVKSKLCKTLHSPDQALNNITRLFSFGALNR